jgi:hypothetical protein
MDLVVAQTERTDLRRLLSRECPGRTAALVVVPDPSSGSGPRRCGGKGVSATLSSCGVGTSLQVSSCSGTRPGRSPAEGAGASHGGAEGGRASELTTAPCALVRPRPSSGRRTATGPRHPVSGSRALRRAQGHLGGGR